MSNLINGDRIRQVRELHQMTQKELADLVDLKQNTLADIEARAYQPSEQVIQKIALQTGFPPEYFRQPSTVHFPLGSLLFRARSTMTAGERNQAHRYGEVLFEVAQFLAARVRGLEPRLPRLEEPPSVVADMTRAALGYSPTAPIDRLIRLLELQGVIVLVVPVKLEKRDAYAVWAGMDARRPVIVITGDPLGDRLRWSLAHELGHLVLYARGSIADMERDANAFAAQFLLPEEAMRQELVEPVTLTSLAKLKPRWGVSIQALVMRAHDLNIITDRQYRYLFEQISKRGWRVREPEHLDIPIERPRALRQMAEILYGDPVDYHRLAADVHMSPSFLRRVIEAIAPKATRTASPRDVLTPANLMQFPDTAGITPQPPKKQRDRA
jgi:Zn-dependent peptidase ImmA (M78 family)/DNA-binding XRE family transcriptional regulator